MDSRIKIRDAIQAGKVTEATSMVHQLYPELLDDDRYLFFHLQVSYNLHILSVLIYLLKKAVYLQFYGKKLFGQYI